MAAPATSARSIRLCSFIDTTSAFSKIQNKLGFVGLRFEPNAAGLALKAARWSVPAVIVRRKPLALSLAPSAPFGLRCSLLSKRWNSRDSLRA